jgi:hypothetical protein
MNEGWRLTAEAYSAAPDGSRKIWDLVWKAEVPPKVQNFAWRLATDSLPTWQNKMKRTLRGNGSMPFVRSGS